jgi:hypothetical protein
MRKLLTLLAVIGFLFHAGCSNARNSERTALMEKQLPASQGGGGSDANSASSAPGPQNSALNTEKVSLKNAEGAESAQQAFDRKIIRNADFQLETKSTTDAQRRLASIVESHGGFVVTSEATQSQGTDTSKPDVTVKLVARVPVVQFQAVLDAIHALDGRIKQEKITGQDVSEEYIDLEARIKSKKALEAQFMEIMKQARSIEDALAVQTQLADVRTEIEKIEGRRRFLENQSSLSTITLSIEPPAPFIGTSPSGFAHDLKASLQDGIDAAAAIVLFLIRAFLTLLPVAVFVILPFALVIRFLLRRAHKNSNAAPVVAPFTGGE